MPPPEIARAVAALQGGDRAGARSICQAAIQAGQADADLWHILGIVEAQEQRPMAASQAFKASLDINPDHLGSLTNLALLQRQAGRADMAVPLYRRAAGIDPGNIAIQRNLGTALLALGDTDGARAAAGRALEIDPSDTPARRLHLNSYIQSETDEIPLDDIQRLVSEQPDDAANHFIASLAYGRLEREADARAALKRCLALAPTHHQAMNNLARLHFQAGDYGEARRLYEAAIAVKPDYAEARFQLGQLELLLGEYERGWANYAWRQRSHNYRRFGNRAQTGLPFWDGSPLAGRRLVVYAEQGLGDTIQFLRYLPQIEANGGQVTCFVQKALAGLLDGFDPGAAEIRFFEDVGAGEVEADVQSPLLSLPGLLWSRAGPAAAEAYLRPNSTAVATWRAWLAGRAGDRHVGLVWSGNPHHPNDRNRSMPTEALAKLVSTPGIDWVSLHVGPAAAKSADPVLGGRVANVSDRLTGFADTAALMSALDLIVSVDTAPAHVAGALGAPIWTLLPHVPDWRWGLTGDGTIWYPSMRLFRQRTPQDWADVLARVAGALRTGG